MSNLQSVLSDITVLDRIARVGCGGDNVRWSFSDDGLRETIVAAYAEASSISPELLADFRAMRLFHWKQARNATARINDYLRAGAFERISEKERKYYEQQHAAAQSRWSRHMRYVQALNQMFDTPRGDTAERDEEREKELAQSKREE